MVKYKNTKRIVVGGVALGILGGAIILGGLVGGGVANGLDACVTEECQEAREEADEATVKADEALDAAKMYEMKVAELTGEISVQEDKIARTEDRIEELKKEIEKTEENLNKKQEALAEMLVDMHFDNEHEPIKILAGSSSISDLAEKASRGQVARQQISVAAGAVRDTKERLEEDKQEVETLLDEQQQTRRDLVAKRKEQKEIQQKYKEDAETFAAEAKAARQKQREEEQAQMEAHPELYAGGVAYTGANTYPWQHRCPQDQDDFATGGGYYGCECVSYADWKWKEAYGDFIYGWGDAKMWDDHAIAEGYRVDHTPEPGSIGQFDDGPYGHVFWVEGVNGPYVDITEYNNAYATQILTGTFAFGSFGARTITMAEAQQYNYIHRK